jgi:hypothetical protein
MAGTLVTKLYRIIGVSFWFFDLCYSRKMVRYQCEYDIGLNHNRAESRLRLRRFILHSPFHLTTNTLMEFTETSSKWLQAHENAQRH